MNNTIIETGDKRTARLTEAELDWLRQSTKQTTTVFMARKLKMNRISLINTIARGSAHPSTVKKIRRSFQKAVAFLCFIFLLSGCYCARPVAVLTASEMKAKIEADSTILFYQMKGWSKTKVPVVKHFNK